MGIFNLFGSTQSYTINGTCSSIYGLYKETVAQQYGYPYQRTPHGFKIMAFDVYDVETRNKYPMAFLPPGYPIGESLGTSDIDVLHYKKFGHQDLMLLLEEEANRNIQEKKDILKRAEVQIYLSG